MGWASEQLLRDLAKAGIYPLKGETERPSSCVDCPFVIQDEDTGHKICGLDEKRCEFDGKTN